MEIVRENCLSLQNTLYFLCVRHKPTGSRLVALRKPDKKPSAQTADRHGACKKLVMVLLVLSTRAAVTPGRA